jgi:hypothetical protein
MKRARIATRASKAELPKDLKTLSHWWKQGHAKKADIQKHLDHNWPDGGITVEEKGMTLWRVVEMLTEDNEEREEGEAHEKVLARFPQSTDFALYYDMWTHNLAGPYSLSALYADKKLYDMTDKETRQCFADAAEIVKHNTADSMVCIYSK